MQNDLKNFAPEWVAEKGHVLTTASGNCTKCGTAAIDLYEDAAYGPVRDCTAPTTDSTELGELIRQRDDLNVRIKLMEDGIRKAKYDACMLEQHLNINESRKAKGLRQISQDEFHTGIIYD